MKIDPQHHIGVSYFDQPFLWKLVAHELSEKAKTFDLQITAKVARRVTEQIDTIKALIAARVNVLIIAPIVSEIPGLLPLLSQARLNGIGVILLGREMYGAESLPVVRADTATGQMMLAEHVFRHLGATGAVAFIRPLGSAPTLRRVQAFFKVLSHYPHIELVKDITRDGAMLFVKRGVAPMGGVWAKQIVREHPEIRAIFAPSDNVALGVVEYLASRRLTKQVIVAGFDATPAGLYAMKRGKLFATVALPARDMAHELLQHARSLLEKRPVPAETLLPVRLITRDDADELLASILRSLPRMRERKYW